MSGARISVSTPFEIGFTHEGTDDGHCASLPSVFACSPPGRPRNSPSPWSALVPDLVTMLTAALEVQPNSAENAFDSTVISWIAPTGTVAIIVWRPHGSSLLAPSMVTAVSRRPPAPVTE